MWRLALVVLIAAGLVAVLAAPGFAQPQPEQPEPSEPPIPTTPDEEPPDTDLDEAVVPDVPDIIFGVESEDPALSRTVVIILLLTLGSVAPGLLLLMTTFTRFIIVLGLTKQALAVQTVPPAQVLVGLALFLSLFVMGPIFTEINEEAIQPLLEGEMGQQEAFEAGFEPLRGFMLDQVEESDLELFVELSGEEPPDSPEELGPTTIVPAFVVSELRTAFIIGFVIFVPFLIIDLVVAATLMSLGMVMLPPVFISLPIKLLLFILVDGWVLLVGSLVNSVNGVVT
ncbi:flagellar biosynthesis protein FliP [Egibacter rhizosphaerae]|uniref:Flagellar biosynthetic protein FliP n=1 Tax=Egibacter rhizosphaerae TaxID=1670831 RepID=A0A411YLP8_9ACTN|nr:flagellar biosynthesis protein FliP [Egibacter rhizosphaerae]